MYKALILIVCFYSLSSFAESYESTCALGVQELGENKFSFFYTRQNTTDQAYFYVKAMKENENPEKTVDAFMITGKALTPVQDSALLYYQATEDTKKLLIMKTKVKLVGADTSTLIKPIIETKNPVVKIKRNPTDFGQAWIPPQTSCKENTNNPVIYEHTLQN